MKILVTSLAVSVAQLAFAQTLPLPEIDGNTIGYKTADEALAALRAQPGVEITDQQGWTIATDRSTQTIWSFAPKAHPAFPSVVKRKVTEHDGSVYINMSVLCQSRKPACDKLVVEFNELNRRMQASMAKKPE